MKILRPFTNAAALLSVLMAALPVYAQDDDIGGFSISALHDEVEAQQADDDDGGTAALSGSDADAYRPQENYALVMLRIVGYLVIVTAIVFALAWVVRKFGAGGVPRVGAGSNMDIIETLYLGQNKGVALIRVGNIVYLIGHTPDNIVHLEKIEGETAVELIASSKGGSSIMSFKDAFNNFLGKMKKT